MTKLMKGKTIGWHSNNNIVLVKIGRRVFALHGWNGESYLKSWECFGEFWTEAGEKEYTITPVFKIKGESDSNVIGYMVKDN